jgi:hypothetical protein
MCVLSSCGSLRIAGCLLAALILPGCSDTTAPVSFECNAKVTKSDGWKEREALRPRVWSIDLDPYTRAERGRMWEFMFLQNEFVIITDVVGDPRHCWIECGPIKRTSMPQSKIIFENGMFSGRFRWFKSNHEYWEFRWRRVFGFVVSASGSMAYTIEHVHPDNPVQKPQHARIDFSC